MRGWSDNSLAYLATLMHSMEMFQTLWYISVITERGTSGGPFLVPPTAAVAKNSTQPTT